MCGCCYMGLQYSSFNSPVNQPGPAALFRLKPYTTVFIVLNANRFSNMTYV